MNSREYMRAVRRELHACPETGYALSDTQAILKRELAALGITEVRVFAKIGLRAVIRASKLPKRGILAFRSDMDALPVTENTGCSFASRRKGFMHACGHDGHMAMLLGLAKYASEYPLPWDIVLIFQPAEETEGGAKPMLEEGLFADLRPDAIFGYHLMPTLPEGSIGVRSGALMANNTEFEITVEGKSAHGAMPETGIDAIVAAAAFIMNAQTLVSRRIPPGEMGVVSFGTINGGTATNIIASKVILTGTLRSFDNTVAMALKTELCRLLAAAETGYGVKNKYRELVSYPAVINDAGLAKKVGDLLGERATEPKPLMIAEDFSEYQRAAKGLYLFLGCGSEAKGYTHPLHSDCFNFDEEVLEIGLQGYIDIINGL